MPNQNDATTSHYFASTYAAWAVAQTREQAIKDALRRTREAVRGRGEIPYPLIVQSCFVPLPQSSGYMIDWFLPTEDTGRTDIQHHEVSGPRGKPVLKTPAA